MRPLLAKTSFACLVATHGPRRVDGGRDGVASHRDDLALRGGRLLALDPQVGDDADRDQRDEGEEGEEQGARPERAATHGQWSGKLHPDLSMRRLALVGKHPGVKQ